MMWDDMLNPWHNGGVEDMQVQFGGEAGKTSEAIETIPRDIIMLVWWYESADKFGKMKNSPAYFQSKGFDYIVAGYKDTPTIKKWADSVRGKKKCLGIMDTVWEQFENNLDAIRYTADVSWN
jgi:phage tail sheath gpL-like